MRRKDPVKRAVWIGGFVVAVALIGSFSLQVRIKAVRSDVAGLNATWKGIETKVKEVEGHRRTAQELHSKLTALDQFTTNRTLWASFLNALQDTTTENVQLVRLKTEQSFVPGEAIKARTNAANVVIPARPACVNERIVVTLDAKDFSPRQGENVGKFKEALVKPPFLAEQLQKTNKIELISQSAPMLEHGRAHVLFSLQLYFQDKERRLYD